MTVEQYRGLFYALTKTGVSATPEALVLALLNQAELDFATRTYCLKGTPVSRLSMVDEQSYAITDDKGYLDTASGYKWTASGSGTNEYYCELTAGGDPSIDEPDNLHMDGVLLTAGTVGSLADHEWVYGDNDSLGYDTVYVADASGDPDTTEAVILLEPGGFGSTDFLKILRFRYDSDDITLNERDIGQISIDESSFALSKQFWAQWKKTLYLDPLPGSSKTMQIWPAIKPTAMTIDSNSPAIEEVYHPALLQFLLWRHFEGLGRDANRANDHQRQYLITCEEARADAKTIERSSMLGTRRVFP